MPTVLKLAPTATGIAQDIHEQCRNDQNIPSQVQAIQLQPATKGVRHMGMNEHEYELWDGNFPKFLSYGVDACPTLRLWSPGSGRISYLRLMSDSNQRSPKDVHVDLGE